MKKKIYTIVVNDIEYQFASKKEADNFFIDAFLSGKRVYELK